MTPEQLADVAMKEADPFEFIKDWFGRETKEADYIGVARFYTAIAATSIVQYRLETRMIENAAKALATP